MAVVDELDALESLAEIVGWREALLLAAWAGGRNLSIPTRARDEHILARLIGVEPLQRLIDDGLPLRAIPSCDLKPVRLRGHVHRLSAQDISATQIADLLGVTDRTIQRHARALGGGGRMFGLDGTTEQLGSAPRTKRKTPPAMPSQESPGPQRRTSNENAPRELPPKPRASPPEVIAALEAERLARACASARTDTHISGV